MAYRLPSERVPLTVDEGPFAGLSLEVERVAAWALYRAGIDALARFFAASDPVAEMAALRSAFGLFAREAQPTWDIVDHRGPVPATVAGMLRLPLPLALAIIEEWLGAFGAAVPVAPAPEERETAVDLMVPPGELREMLRAGLIASEAA